MTAPDMVSVITAALAGHRTVHEVLYADYYSCSCGHRGKEQPAAHQARAVLAALEGAGSVQFGVKGDGRVKGYGRDRRSAQLDARRRRATFVSRLTLPWAAVEG